MLLKINETNPDYRKIAEVVECLRNGGIIIYPTDTVYSFGCDLNNRAALEKMAQIKDIPLEEANFSLVCYDLKHISEFTAPFSKSTFKMMKRTLPGPYTFILNANRQVPKLFSRTKTTIGIRVPDNNIARSIVHELGNPLISTSVRAGENEFTEYYSEADDMFERYGKQVGVVIDGGPSSLEGSTVVDATEEEPYLIREGKGEPAL